jgi:hypothetical protein
MSSSLIRTFLVALFSIISVAAQDPAPEENSKTKSRNARFICSKLPDKLENPVKVQFGKEVVPLLLSTVNMSQAVKIPEDGIIRIVREVPNPEDPTKPQYVTLAQAAVSEDAQQALVVLIPMAEPKGGLVFHSKVTDITNIKGGNTMFINLTNLKVGIELDKQAIGIGAGETKLHNPLGTKPKASLPVSFQFYDPEKKKWELITQSTMAFYSTRREICFFTWNEQYKRIEFSGVTFPAEF